MSTILAALLKGILVGFSLAAPVGPIGVLTIRRTLTEGRRSAFSTVLGAAAADMVYGLVAVFGLTLVSNFIAGHIFWIRLVGGTVLVILGVRTIRAPLPKTMPRLSFNDHAGNVVSSFLLTLTNPLTLFAFAAVFAGVDTTAETARFDSASALVGGVFCGSVLWFSCLITASYFFRSALQDRGLALISRIAGGLITVFGVVTLVSLFI